MPADVADAGHAKPQALRHPQRDRSRNRRPDRFRGRLPAGHQLHDPIDEARGSRAAVELAEFQVRVRVDQPRHDGESGPVEGSYIGMSRSNGLSRADLKDLITGE